MPDPVLYVLAGAAVGALIGFTGVGGGSLMTPILLLAGQAPTIAVGTHLLFSATTKIAAASAYGARGRIEWAVVRRMLAGSIPEATAVVDWLGVRGRDAPGLDRMLVAWLSVARGT